VRRRATSDVIPADLQTFDCARWIQDAVDHHDPLLSPRLRALTPDELQEDWYAVRILAPARYRAALWEAVGQRSGDRHFYDVAKVQAGTAAAVWADS
jgi:hypothetical protein